MSEPAVVQLQLESAPESVTLVRAGLKGFGKLLDLDAELLDDLQMVASEACNNVVLHAYPQGRGPLDVEIAATRGGVRVVVRDHGTGIEPGPPDPNANGLGLLVMESLADDTEILSGPDGGTEVRLSFAREIPSIESFDDQQPHDAVAERALAALAADVVATISPPELLSDVLDRLARALAAQARFSVERFPDVRHVVDSLVGHTQRFASSGRISIALETDTRQLMFKIGPLRGAPEERSSRSDDGAVPRLRQLADTVEFEPINGSELLCLTLSEGGLAHAV